jgi:hypothetical protein
LSTKLTVSRRRLLQTLIDDPALPALLTHMPPATLARLVDHLGLNDSAEIMMFAPVPTLLRALDESIWKSPRPGMAQVFDAGEFIQWLEAWNEIGEIFVAQRLAAMSDEYLRMCLSSLLRVGTPANSEFYAMYGQHLVSPISPEEWEVIRDALDAFWRHEPDRLLHTLDSLNHGESMLDCADRRRSLNLDVEFARQLYRERRGFVTATGARAFLTCAAGAAIQESIAMSSYDLETQRLLSVLASDGDPRNPIDDAAVADFPVGEVQPRQDSVTALQLLLEEAAITAPARLQLCLPAGGDPTLSTSIELLEHLQSSAAETQQRCARELAYLASVLMAGASLENSRFNGRDSRDAALATCNLGLEYLQSKQLELRLDVEPGLIRLFTIGWQLLRGLREDVLEAIEHSYLSPPASQRLDKQPWLRLEVAIGIRDLRKALDQLEYGDARDAVIFLSIFFDASACRAIAPIFDEVPHCCQSRWISSLTHFDIVGAHLSRLVTA